MHDYRGSFPRFCHKPRTWGEPINVIFRVVALVSESDQDKGRDVELKRTFKVSSNMVNCSIEGDSNS